MIAASSAGHRGEAFASPGATGRFETIAIGRRSILVAGRRVARGGSVAARLGLRLERFEVIGVGREWSTGAWRRVSREGSP